MQKGWLILFLLVFSFTNVLAADRFMIGTGDENNTVTDTTTGLMWERSPNSSFSSWGPASILCESLNGSEGRGGYEDWRVPTVEELSSLLDYHYYGLCLPNLNGTGKWSNGNPFILKPIGTWLKAWSSTLPQGNPHFPSQTYAWVISFEDCSSQIYSKTENTQVMTWCVRGTMNNFSSSSSEEKIVYVNNTVYLNNCSDTVEPLDCSDYVNSSQKIIYLNNTVNNTVYVNNCTSKNLTCENKSSEKSLDYKTGIVIFSAMGLVIIGLIVLSFYFYSKSE